MQKHSTGYVVLIRDRKRELLRVFKKCCILLLSHVLNLEYKQKLKSVRHLVQFFHTYKL